MSKRVIEGCHDVDGNPIHIGDKVLVWLPGFMKNAWVVKVTGGRMLHLTYDGTFKEVRRQNSRYVRWDNIQYMVKVVPYDKKVD